MAPPSKQSKAEMLNKLISDRKQIIGRLERFKEFLEGCDNLTNRVKIQERLVKCEMLWYEYDKIQLEIQYHEDSPEQTTQRVKFEEDYFEVICGFKEFLTHNDVVINKVNSTSPKVRLPALDLPSFSGSYDNWMNFFDTFVALIHNDVNLTEVQKFYYLQSCLKGEAAQVIQSIKVTNLNYEIAWKSLRERYENTKLIIQNHLKALFELQPVLKESAISLRKMLDTILRNVRALKSLKEPVDKWDSILIHLIISKLDAISKREWETHIVKRETVKFDDFVEFLTERCQVLESLESSKVRPSYFQVQDNKPQMNSKYRNSSHSFITTQNQCAICQNGSHPIYNCTKFLKLSEYERVEEIKKLHLCLNCFKSTHFSSRCPIGGCKKCGKPHNTLLHIDGRNINNNSPGYHINSSNEISSNKQGSSQITPNSQSHHIVTNESERSMSDSKSNHSVTTHSSSCYNNNILLSTAVVMVYDDSKNQHRARVLLDSGSMSNFMTSDLCSRLKLPTKNVNMSVVGISSVISKSSRMVDARIKSRINSFSRDLSFLVLDKITNYLPSFTYNKELFKIPCNIALADPHFNEMGPIDMLLGAGIFYDLLSAGQIKSAENLPILQKTELGWIVSGSVPMHANANNVTNIQTTCNLTTYGIQEQMEAFWKLEEMKPKKVLTMEEQECEDLFVNTTIKEKNGQFIVELPTRKGIQNLGDSKELAIKRFKGIERKLSRNEDMKKEYIAFMREYEELGHMTELSSEEIEVNEPIYYLPHHPVFKDTSTTTKMRVVYDASAKTNKGISLNDMLKTGPVIQEDLYSIIVRFRKYQYVFGADIEKMYRQVWVARNQRNLQRIVWRWNPEENMRHFVLNTVTYGTAPASYLAIRSLIEATAEYEHIYPEACKVIKRDFYVDDLLSGTNSIEEAMKIKKEISEILEKSGFVLRKWMSNKREIFEDTNENAKKIKQYIINQEVTRTLGLIWNIQEDTMQYTVKIESNLRATKRNILSVISKVFDPLGIIGPVIVCAKIIMQKLWSEKLEWDDEISSDLFNRWSQFYTELPFLNNLSVPRLTICEDSLAVELHGYCDASEQAYGACVFVRSKGRNGQIFTNLLCAKSRIAPMKTITLPRLELCGALLLSRLMAKTVVALSMNISNVFYWTDATIVLSWIAAEPYNWSTFVSHRVSEIQRNTNGNWGHVKGEENPADIISRGCNPEKLIKSELWWKGPEWLRKEEEFWPKSEKVRYDTNVPEKRSTKLVFMVEIDQGIFSKYSTYLRLQRVVSYCLRFIRNSSSNKENRSVGYLTVSELNAALICLVKIAQTNDFLSEIKDINSKKQISRHSKILDLNPFMDEKGVLRVGGRLGKSTFPYDQRYPMILSKNHKLSTLIIMHEHKKELHAGAQTLLCNIRSRFWILGGINTIKRVLKACLICFRAKPKHSIAIMGELPEQRITPSRPFLNSGVDYAGPFNIKSSKLRTSKILKGYLCVFVCLVTKAVHLELVSDLSTESFLNSLKRFIARRGKCQNIFSDNGTNFVGANNSMREFFELLKSKNFEGRVYDYLSNEGITWKFIPPRSPHFGGLWEASIKVAKNFIKRILCNALLTFEEFATVLTQIEACMNSRPLGPISNDPSDLNPLTPGHFLVGEPLVAFPEANVTSVKINKLSKYQHMTQIVQHFWQRWSKECVSNMNKRSKWRAGSGSILKIGDMIILKDENLPPLRWPLGRIERLYPGTDGVVRVVDIKTNHGTVKRAITKICVLPVDCNL